MVCHDHIDGATLYTDSKPADSDASRSVEVGRWSGDVSVKGSATWPLDTAGGGCETGSVEGFRSRACQGR
ncbi:hypothetical protein OG381_34195 [Streptomyces sp. NBC_00490]|uniref:hypothetical protein n=1 Tax=Streptomyces sp. NBC_00490 TaxID=2903657 RepID=UPI002E17C8E4